MAIKIVVISKIRYHGHSLIVQGNWMTIVILCSQFYFIEMVHFFNSPTINTQCCQFIKRGETRINENKTYLHIP